MRSEALMMNLSASQMLDLWKMRSGYSVARRDCAIERDDGIDVDEYFTLEMNRWYAQLLAEAPVEWLPVEDLAAELGVTTDACGVVEAVVPACCVRPVEWHVEGWKRDVVTFHPAGSPEALRQGVEWLRGSAERPVAVVSTGKVTLYSVKPGSEAVVDKALCVVRPADGSFRFSQAALATLPDVRQA